MTERKERGEWRYTIYDPKPCTDGRAHDYVYVDDEYGSLADGGSYEIYDCSICGQRLYSPLPD